MKNIPCTPPRRYADGLMRLKTSEYGDRLLGRVVDVRARVEPHERDAAAVEFGEQRAEPVGVFVVDREGSC